jgi:hypothetical protein
VVAIRSTASEPVFLEELHRSGESSETSYPHGPLDVQADPATSARWLEDAHRHLEAEQTVADIDPSGAYVAYDAARQSVTAALLTTGHRVRSRPGSHQALAQFANQLATQTGEPGLKRFDRLRRNRNRSQYGSRTFGKAEVREAIDTATAIRAACAPLRWSRRLWRSSRTSVEESNVLCIHTWASMETWGALLSEPSKRNLVSA